MKTCYLQPRPAGPTVVRQALAACKVSCTSDLGLNQQDQFDGEGCPSFTTHSKASIYWVLGFRVHVSRRMNECEIQH